jgi:hypothetical protein
VTDSAPSCVILQRDAAPGVWRNALPEIESIFGRLIYLSGLRHQDTGRYGQSGWCELSGIGDADRPLRAAHFNNFSTWLCLTLQQQKADLDMYLSGLPVSKPTVLRQWMREMGHGMLIPDEASQAERQLFLCDLGVILELTLNEYSLRARTSPACIAPLSVFE